VPPNLLPGARYNPPRSRAQRAARTFPLLQGRLPYRGNHLYGYISRPWNRPNTLHLSFLQEHSPWPEKVGLSEKPGHCVVSLKYWKVSPQLKLVRRRPLQSSANERVSSRSTFNVQHLGSAHGYLKAQLGRHRSRDFHTGNIKIWNLTTAWAFVSQLEGQC
jgi:hypothetical protein